MGVRIDIGHGTVGTALHFAAKCCRNDIMRLMLRDKEGCVEPAKSWVKATDGPVINSAICAGNLEGVQLLIDEHLHMYDEDIDSHMSPLAMAANNGSDVMLQTLIDAKDARWTAEQRQDLLIEASAAGNLTAIETYHNTSWLEETGEPHTTSVEIYQEALDAGVEEYSWEAVSRLLDHCPDPSLDCTGAFMAAVRYLELDAENTDTGLLPKLRSRDGEHLDPAFINSCLFVAADNCRTLAVEWLLDECEADPEAAADADVDGHE
jgi:hypothetical protein